MICDASTETPPSTISPSFTKITSLGNLDFLRQDEGYDMLCTST